MSVRREVVRDPKEIEVIETYIRGSRQTETQRIVHMDSDIPTIFMPMGKPSDGGSCAFSTTKCREYCPGGNVINEHEKYTLLYFKETDSKGLVAKIEEDFAILANRPYNAKILQWWAWGDCLPELTDKVATVINILNTRGMTQYGFTRNRELWEKVPGYDRLHLGLTLDSLDDAKELSVKSGKMTACPDTETGYAQMIFDGEIRSRCSGWWCITDEETRNSDCTQCVIQGQGCFWRRPIN